MIMFGEMDRLHRLLRLWRLYDTDDSGSLQFAAFDAMVGDVLFAVFGRDANACDPWVSEATSTLWALVATAADGTSGGASSIAFDTFARAVLDEQAPALFSTPAFLQVVSIAISPRRLPEPSSPPSSSSQSSSRSATTAASTELAVNGDVFMRLLMDRTNDMVTVARYRIESRRRSAADGLRACMQAHQSSLQPPGTKRGGSAAHPGKSVGSPVRKRRRRGVAELTNSNRDRDHDNGDDTDTDTDTDTDSAIRFSHAVMETRGGDGCGRGLSGVSTEERIRRQHACLSVFQAYSSPLGPGGRGGGSGGRGGADASRVEVLFEADFRDLLEDTITLFSTLEPLVREKHSGQGLRADTVKLRSSSLPDFEAAFVAAGQCMASSAKSYITFSDLQIALTTGHAGIILESCQYSLIFVGCK
mmetsp:Transcript_18038/g.47452  ORF Transcript_18038/g.47452 Transcript_18038/m.47452 type:complete len:417 (-) Transcript_18038:531-1781(-)